MAIDQRTPPEETLTGLQETSLHKTYAATLRQIITKANIGRRQLDPEKETPIFVAIWFEALYEVIPERRLNDCYLWAVRNRNNNFPMQPSEMAQAWTAIRQGEMHKRAPVSRQIEAPYCGKCNLTNTELIRNDQGVVIGARPCKH